jgi:hypothetical protein
MKPIQTFMVRAIALALLSATILLAAEAPKNAKAIVRAVHGTAKCRIRGQWSQLLPNMELLPGTKIRTGPDSYVSLNVNGLKSTLRISQNTAVTLTKMEAFGVTADSDTDTVLDLQAGTVLGEVKKLSLASRYDIRVPNGTASIRGGDFQVSVVPQAGTAATVTFTAVTGTVVASVIVKGRSSVQVLHAGQSWTPEPMAR